MTPIETRPFMSDLASAVEGTSEGRTRVTMVEAETTDDESVRNEWNRIGSGPRRPFLSLLATEAEGTVHGRTRITATKETSDDVQS